MGHTSMTAFGPVLASASTTPTLVYVGDPMCSWCWGFHPQLRVVLAGLGAEIPVHWVMGGLAPDSDEPMPEETRAFIQNAWREVEARTGAQFNWEFWETCAPRRSTWPACRAVLAAAEQRAEAGPEMFSAIQSAYYQQARNPSDRSTLVELAAELEPPLDVARFEADLVSPATERRLQQDLATVQALGVRGFPSLLLLRDGKSRTLARGYATASEILAALGAG